MKNFYSILLVDDDDITLFINKRIVSNTKIAKVIETKSNGWEALLYLNECKGKEDQVPDLILLDIQMPELDAWGFLEELSRMKIEKPVTVVLLSGVLHPNHHYLCKEFNIDHYLLKPLTVSSFAQLVENIQEEEVPVNYKSCEGKG